MQLNLDLKSKSITLLDTGPITLEGRTLKLLTDLLDTIMNKEFEPKQWPRLFSLVAAYSDIVNRVEYSEVHKTMKIVLMKENLNDTQIGLSG